MAAKHVRKFFGHVVKGLEKKDKFFKTVFKEDKQQSLTKPSDWNLVKKERIQREIALFSQLYLSLSDKLESAKIDEKDTTSPIFLLDSPSISSYKAGVEFYKGVIFVLFFVFMLALSFELYNNRQQLFK